MIRTTYGPVGLRQPRDPEVIKPAVGEKKDWKIEKKWLTSKTRKHDVKGDTYRTVVKQTMLLAAAKMEVNDIAYGAPGVSIDEKTGLFRSPEEMASRDQLARTKIAGLKDGTVAIPDRHGVGVVGLKKTGRSQTRHLLVKTSKYPWAWYKYRYWSIQSGIMKVTRTIGPEYPGERCRLYDIREASCKFETRDMVGIQEAFVGNYQARVRLLLKERPWGPVFLYSKDVSEVKSWERAIRMSKYLLNATDREAMAFVIGRVAGSIMAKGWNAAFKYYKELEDTRRLIRGLAMRLTKLDLSRAWNKARLVYMQKTQQEKLRKEQQDWAARFLRDKMERINNQTARSPAMIRLAAINKAQLLFRHFRQDHIFDRSYALGTNVNTRVQQMMKGVSMMGSFSSLSTREVLHMALRGEGLNAFFEDIDMYINSKASSYSEVNVDLQKMALSISENFNMLSFSEHEGSSLLHGASWENFVNLNQISSVVLHSERSFAKSRQGELMPPGSCGGVWFTIHGPRVGWGRTLRHVMDPETQRLSQEVIGSPDGNFLGAALANGEQLQWLRLEIGIRSASVPDLRRELPEEGQMEVFGDGTEVRSDFQTFVVLTVLGKRFRSTSSTGSTPSYQGPYLGKFVAEIPLPVGEKGLARLDTSEIGIDVVEQDPVDPEKNRTIWATKMPLWKAFTIEEEIMKPEPPPATSALTTLVGEGALTTLGLVDEVQEEVKSLRDSLTTGARKNTKRLWLMHPFVDLSDALPLKAHLDVEISAKVAASSLLPRTCVSPELQGRGSTVNLFTSHKAAWLDAASALRNMSVPSMVELKIRELIFPSDDPPEDARLYKYFIEAKCNGVRSSSPSLCRPKRAWSYLVPCDSSKIDFKACSIFLPLPPGCWGDDAPTVEVKVLKAMVTELPTVNYQELLANNGKTGPSNHAPELVYHAELSLEAMAVDFSRKSASVPFAKSRAKATTYNVAKDELSPVEAPAVVVMDIALRDRTFARLKQAEDASRAGVVSVGDKAMLRVEEPLAYPLNEVEYRRRGFPGEFQPGRRRGDFWAAPLREPSVSYEYKASGLDQMDPPYPFKQRYMSNSHDDVVPHKFVLPAAEAEFVSQMKPGSYHRIMDMLVAEKGPELQKQQSGETEKKYSTIVVDKLSHLIRHIPVTVLAVYPDQSCDVELASNFIAAWENIPHKPYALQGSVVVGEHMDISEMAIRSAPVGAGDVGERKRRRVLLKGVPLQVVQSVQPASFNIYDAAITTTDEIVRIDPRKIGNDYNPRLIDGTVDDMSVLGGHRGSYRIAAGPLPPDANPTDCQYEWSLRLNAENEADMYHFVTMLRQASRMDIFEQLKKLKEFKQKSVYAHNNRPYLDSQIYSSQSGHLEVILVEAKHLRPTRVQQEQDLQTALSKSLQLDLQVEATFRLKNIDDEGKAKELIYKGSKVQRCPSMTGSNPCWGETEQLKGSGGWVFKSPLLEKAMMPNLYLEIELSSRKYEKLGMIRFLGGAPTLDLSDSKKLYNNLWIPLATVDPATAKLTPKAYGELHLMTVWKPSQETVALRRLPKTVRGWQSWELKQALKGTAMHDPIYDVQAVKRGYDPNLYEHQGDHQEAMNEAKLSHMQKMLESIPYLDCCERQQRVAWRDFRLKLESMSPVDADEQPQRPSLSLLRSGWSHGETPNTRMLWELDELMRRGVPAHNRGEIWFEITGAQELQRKWLERWAEKLSSEADPSVAFYRRLVEDGKPYRNDAMWQLHEDLVAAASWERPTHHTAMARHFHRLKRAEDVCVALIAFSKEDDLGGNPQVPNYQDLDDVNAQGQRVSSAVAYCESLLVLAFHLVVAQTPQTTVKEEVWKEASGNVSAVKTKMQEEAEVRAFWLLYQLSGGHGLQAFRDYYGVPRALRTATNGLEGQLTDRRGAIDDVHRLTFILARFEPEIWVQMQSLGFQLPCLFYGAFMRLFAFVLPVTSLFRFWDLLLADAQRPDLPSYKPARHALLDLAFGGVMACKETILKCQSAMEVQNCLLHFFESIYDPSYLVELVASTEYQLWDDAKSKMPDKVGLGALHTMDYENSVKNWERYFGQHRQQNKILKDITQNATGVGAANQTIASNQSANTNSMGQTGDQRVTTRTVMKVINNFLFQFSTEKMDQTNKAGIIRLMPHELLKMSPADVDTSLVGTVSSWIAVLGERFATPPPPSVLRSAGVPAPRGAMPEPHLDAATWDTQVRKAAGESWGPYAQQIFANFCLPIEKRVSLHEFFLGLICCSKGTVSEKAMALFHLFGYIGPEPMVHHINPISHSTHIIIERNEGKSYQEESNFLKAPRDDEIKTMALHLQIYVYAFGASGMVEVVQGEVFVPTLVPFVTNALVGDNPRTFTIWGPEKQLPPGFSRENDPALLTDHGVRPYVGDMVLDLKWMPESPAKPEVGQLGIQLHSVSLNLDAPETKNPRVEVYTYTESGEKIQLKRWDPRTTMRKVSNALAMAPKVGKYVEWERTMRRNEVTGQLFKKLAAGDHGWNKEEKIWKWSTQWGAQYSVERTVFRKAVCEKAQVTVAGQSAQKPNLITLPACRVIVAGILNRSLHPVTHRQAILMADQIFSRCGAVPGILDALIIEGDVTSASESLTKAKEEFAELGRKWQDMKKYMVVAHELQVMMSSYGLDLFTPEVSRDSGGRPLNLQMLEIKDPFPGQSKTLWLRYCRAGDGQRYNSRIPVDPDGALRGGRVKLDYDYEADPEGANLQLQLNKQEFVNCFCSSSILHETLAQFSTSDNSTANVPDGIAINLDVTIADPTKEEADADLMDTLNVRQGVLLEVWDADMGKSDDFLGECWLPALGSLTAAPKRYVLPVTNAPPEKGATRYHSKKFSKVTCEGHLIVDASWTFPSETVPPLPDAADMEKRVKREEILHTGKLKLKIIKAEGLRGADRGFRREGSDPYVCMYVKNEAFFRQEKEKIPPGFDENGWHQTALGRHECYWTTSTKKATRNPEWNEEKEFMLRTGAFERRTKQAYHLELTSRQATRHRDDYYAAVLGNKEELRMYFGPKDTKEKDGPGMNHNIQIYLGDNMHQFKDKLAAACKAEAAVEKNRKRQQQLEAVANDMSYRHSVMVFVPSQRLRELAQQGKVGVSSYEYKRLYRIEEQDPSSWQPLDSICTFMHYSNIYSFGRSVAQRLRVVDGTEQYRLKNNRLRQFEREQKKYQERLQDMNMPNKCFGYAKFQHPSDGNSLEWRPALINRSEQVGTSKKTFKVSYVYSSHIANGAPPEDALAPGPSFQEELDEEAILPAPSDPKIKDFLRSEHKEFLARAKILKEQGMADTEILRQLNEELKQSWAKSKEADDGSSAYPAQPPTMTLADVQEAIRSKADDETLSTFPPGSTMAPGSTMTTG
ncbi:unnamed protein product [Durusdinium trenchii]|uniref:Uncharacterized protein n=1 Tax=Durusdinium trenchii TaxID=1381693 RepID=A0ABP0SRC8_9DINO